jgi:hypothetical protein
MFSYAVPPLPSRGRASGGRVDATSHSAALRISSPTRGHRRHWDAPAGT